MRGIITATRTPSVAAGHVAGWVGVGGPGQGPNGTDEWVQVGLASMPGLPSVLYAEITKPGRAPNFQVLEDEVPTGESREVAVLEIAHRPGWWRIWVSGNPASGPIHLRGSSGRYEPIATAESWNGNQPTCNSFAFRFERVSVSYGGGGSWRPFVPGGALPRQRLPASRAGEGAGRERPLLAQAHGVERSPGPVRVRRDVGLLSQPRARLSGRS